MQKILTKRNCRGFTIIEIVVVLIMIGILSAVAIARAMDNTPNEIAAANALKAHLRFAQAQALNSDKVWGVEYVSSNSYRLYYIDNDETPTRVSALLPGETSDPLVLSRVTIGTEDFDVSFDSWGRPTGNASINIGDQTVTITPDTGFIQ